MESQIELLRNQQNKSTAAGIQSTLHQNIGTQSDSNLPKENGGKAIEESTYVVPDVEAAYAQESYMNIKLNDPSDNDENTAGFIEDCEEEESIYYNRERGRGTGNSSKGEKSQQRIN